MESFATLLSSGTRDTGRTGGESTDAPDSASDESTSAGDEVSVDPASIAAATDDQLSPAHRSDLAAHLSTLSADDAASAERTRTLASEFAADGVAPSSFLDSYLPLFESLVDDAFADVQGGETAAADLKRNLAVALDDMRRGVEVLADDARDDRVDRAVDLDAVVEAIPYSTFLVDDEHTVVAYNSATQDQLDLDPTEALGEDCRESIAAATYSDGRRHYTLADKVIEAPRTADREYDVDRIDDSYAFGDRIVYEDRSLMNKADGTKQHISFQAMPLFDDDGELAAVLEFVEDQSEEIQRKETMESLVDEVCTTLQHLGDGDLSARAEFTDDRGVIDSELLRIVTHVNEMIDDFEDLITEVGEETSTLAASIDEATDAAATIDRQVQEQNDALDEVASEMESFSATMEEVAASADEVSDAAEDALAEADEGREAGQAARAATEDVLSTSHELVETVAELDGYMDEIEAVTDVIADVAEQTNLLALNANIEAARAGEDGNGFAVVADEVKQLANETQSHTEEIADRVTTVQAQTGETVHKVEQSHDQIREADERIQDAVASLESISETVEDATAGITEVAAANEDQAVTVEEVLATIDEATQNADTVSETVDTIVAETERQQRSVDTLSTHVDALRNETSD